MNDPEAALWDRGGLMARREPGLAADPIQSGIKYF